MKTNWIWNRLWDPHLTEDLLKPFTFPDDLVVYFPIVPFVLIGTYGSRLRQSVHSIRVKGILIRFRASISCGCPMARPILIPARDLDLDKVCTTSRLSYLFTRGTTDSFEIHIGLIHHDEGVGSGF